MRSYPAVRTAVVATVLALLVTACATPEPRRNAEGDPVICRQEVPTGTLRPTMRCRTVEEARRDQDEADRTLNSTRPTTSGTSSTGR